MGTLEPTAVEANLLVAGGIAGKKTLALHITDHRVYANYPPVVRVSSTGGAGGEASPPKNFNV